jgi:hypothetical protein
MNRLRHAYLELAPELEPYFVTAHHDDEAGIMRTYGLGYRFSFGRILAGTPTLVGALNVVVAGVLAALTAAAFGTPDAANVAVGVVVALAAAVGHGALAFRSITSTRRAHRPCFPADERPAAVSLPR